MDSKKVTATYVTSLLGAYGHYTPDITWFVGILNMNTILNKICKTYHLYVMPTFQHGFYVHTVRNIINLHEIVVMH